jgi:hypothetical protein
LTWNISISLRPVSAKKVRAVSLLGSRPLSTRACTGLSGKDNPRSTNDGCRVPVEGRAPRYRASSGTTSSTSKAPAKKNVKSAALANAFL